MQFAGIKVLASFPLSQSVIVMDGVKTLSAFVSEERRIGNLIVPSFSICPGEIVKIELRPEYSKFIHEFEESIIRDFQHVEKVATINLPMTRSWFREFFHRQTAAEFLVANFGLAEHDANERLQELQVRLDLPLCMLAGNPRWMIGFVGAMSQQPDVLVFTTIGCDATGMRRGLAALRDQLGNTAAVYLSCFNDLNIVEPEYAAVIEATSLSQAVLS